MSKHLLLLCLVVAWCLSLLTLAYVTEPVKIGVSLSLTGRYSAMGISQYNAFKLWQKHINAKGGLLSKPVTLIVYDDKSDPETAKQLYEHLINNDKVNFLFGPYSTPLTEAVIPITEKHNLPLLITGASADKIWQQSYRHVIGVFTPVSLFLSGIFELIVEYGLDNIAIIHADDSFSKELAKHAQVMAKRYGLKVVLSTSFVKGTKDLTGYAQLAKDSGANVVILGGHFEEALDMTKALKKISWRPKVYYAAVGAAIDDYVKELKKDADYTFSTSLWEFRANFPGSQKFYNDYIKTYGKPPVYHAAIAYAGGQVLEEAIMKAGTLDRQKVRDEFFKMDSITILGRYSIDSTGRQIRQHSFIIQWQKGKREILWPKRLATSKPMF